jgi:ribosomal-protein-alanine N-acetyltransferase
MNRRDQQGSRRIQTRKGNQVIRKTLAKAHIRWMIRQDFPEVLRLESACFDNPWTEDQFIKALRQRHCIGMVLELEGRIRGFMVYELHHDSITLLDLAVDPSYQRSGLGRQLIAKLINKLQSHSRSKINLHVSEINLRAQLFFKSQGFKAVRVVHDYFEESNEDLYLMELSL